MTADERQNVTEDRELIESSVRRIVGIAALRRIHRIISDRKEEERILRKVVAPIAALLMIVVAALIWHFGSPRTDPSADPLPQCSPAPGEKITI